MAQPVQFGPVTTPAKAAEAAFADSLPDLNAPSVSVPLDDARRIILAFYSPSIGADLRRRLDRWLEKYQTRPEAWAMADKFLTADLDATSPTGAAATTSGNSGGAPTAEQQQLMLFAAITMHHKIRYDFLDLPAESIPSLRDTLLRHIARLVNRGPGSGTGPVLSRLCLAFASLVVQTKTTSGEEAVASIVALFPPGSPGAVALLEILTTVAEEANSRRTPISASRRDAFLGGLRASAPSVLGLLQSVLHSAATAGQSAVVERVFRCFGAWVGACDLPPVLVAECPLFQNVFDALLRYPALFSVACDTIHELLRAYRDPIQDAAVINKLLPAVLSLSPLFDQAVNEEDEDQLLSLARMFADAACAYLKPLLASASEAGTAASAMQTLGQLFSLVIKCASHAEPTVSAATFTFWTQLFDEMYHLYTPAQTAIKGHLAPAMLDLSQRMVERLRFPAEFGGWTADRRDDFKHSYRYDVSDVLLCCCEVTGWKPVLDALARKLQTDLQAWQATLAAAAGRPGGVEPGALPGWEGVEAGLYSIRAIARYVPDDEAAVLPSLFALLPQLPPHTELRATSFRLIGRYHQWMARHPDAAGPCFEFVVTRGLLPRPEAGPGDIPICSPAQECACNAIRDLGGSGARVPALRDALLALPGRVNILALESQNALKVAEAVCSAVGTLPPGQHERHLAGLLTPVLGVLSAFAADPAGACEAASSSGLLLAAATHQDGVIRANNLRSLGLDESAAEALVAEGRAAGGRVRWQPSVYRVEKVAGTIVRAMLNRILALLRELRVDQEALRGAGLPRHTDMYALPEAEQEANRRRMHELTAAAEASLARVVTATIESSWPVLEALARRFGRSASDSTLDYIGGVWAHGMRFDPVAFARFLPKLLPMLLTFASEAPSPDVLRLVMDLLHEYIPKPQQQQNQGRPGQPAQPPLADERLISELFATAVRVLDAVLAPLLRPDLYPAPPPGTAGRAAGPGRGYRAYAEDPYLYDAAFRLGTALMHECPERLLTCGGSVVSAVAADGAASPAAGGGAVALACGAPLHALLTAALAALAFYDRYATAAVCSFLRAVLTAAVEPPLLAPPAGGGGGHSAGSGHVHPHGARHRAPHDTTPPAVSAAAAAALQARRAAILPALLAPVRLPPSALAVTGPNALVLPGAATDGGSALCERLYKRLLAAGVHDFPLEAVTGSRDGHNLLGGVIGLLHRLFPASPAQQVDTSGPLPSCAHWLHAVLSDASVVRPGLVAPARLQELALALLQPGLSSSQLSSALADLAEAARGLDSGRAAVSAHGGHGGGGGRRYGAAAEDDSDEDD